MSIHQARVRYAELRHLLEGGVPLEDAMRRTEVPSVEAVYRWALRNGDTWLRDCVLRAYAVEKWQKEVSRA